ncbi:MAG TPA: TOBE domain-containing protein [Bacteroidota bacterium]|nr:TOBE domain-containing protein [Bacteroidota bacterium]
MNSFTGRISSISTSGAVSRVGVDVGGSVLSAVVLETPGTASYLRTGSTIVCLFKETEVGLARDLSGPVSYGNRIDGTVESVEEGVLFTRIRLDWAGGKVTALIGTAEAAVMAVKGGDRLTALVNPAGISLMVPDNDA